MLAGSRSAEGRRYRWVEALWVLLGCWLVLSFEMQAQAVEETPVIERLNPPYFGFYAKAIDCDGVFVRGSAQVEDRALVSVCTLIRKMTASTDVAKQNLRQRGVELHIFGKDQSLSDLPENAGTNQNVLPGSLGKDRLGGRASSGIYNACGEENLPESPSLTAKSPADLCLREFAVALMNYGFDEEIRRLIEAQYHSSVTAGHWNGTRAAASPEDYWAQLSILYFHLPTEPATLDRLAGTAASAVRAEDPSGFALLDLLYSQKKRPVAIEAIRARAVSKLALSRISTRPAELQLVNNGSKNIRIFWIDTEGEIRPVGELRPYNRTIEKTFLQHVWMIEDQRGVEIQRFVVEDYVSEVIAAY